MVLSSICAFGNPEAKAIINEIVEDVALKKGVKRTVEELVGDETFSLYVESLQVPDWVSPYFKTKARISGNTWQAVINITNLGGTGVRFILSNQCYKAGCFAYFMATASCLPLKVQPYVLVVRGGNR